MDQTILIGFLNRGGPAMWAIAALSVVLMAVILWKLFDLLRLGVWSSGQAEAATVLWVQGKAEPPQGNGLRARIIRHAMMLRLAPETPEHLAREETARLAKQGLVQARSGLRVLDLIATVSPLIGLLGTVLGMIDAFQALQDAGNRADPSALAGGIWQALLTTAAGMAVAIPASIALTWFDAIVESAQADIEDLATRIFTSPIPAEPR